MLERLFLIVGAEDDELGVEPLERRLELVLVLDADDELDAVAELELVGRAGRRGRPRPSHRK